MVNRFYEQELLGAADSNVCPAEENVEAICHFFNTIGKQLDESPKSRRINDMYFGRLKELSTNPQLAPRMKFMVRDVIDLRASNWVPRREEVNCSLFTVLHIYIMFQHSKVEFTCFLISKALMFHSICI